MILVANVIGARGMTRASPCAPCTCLEYVGTKTKWHISVCKCGIVGHLVHSFGINIVCNQPSHKCTRPRLWLILCALPRGKHLTRAHRGLLTCVLIALVPDDVMLRLLFFGSNCGGTLVKNIGDKPCRAGPFPTKDNSSTWIEDTVPVHTVDN